MNAGHLAALANEQRIDTMVADMKRRAAATPAQLAAFVLEQQLTTPAGNHAACQALRERINERRDRAEMVHFEERLVDAVKLVRSVVEQLDKALAQIERNVASAREQLATVRGSRTSLYASTFSSFAVVEAGALTQQLQDALDEVHRAAGDLAKFGERLQATDEERATMIAEREESRKRRIEARAKALRKEPKVDLRSKAVGMQLTGWATAGRDELAMMIATAEEARP